MYITGKTLKDCKYRKKSHPLHSQANTPHHIHISRKKISHPHGTGLDNTICHIQFIRNWPGNWGDHLCFYSTFPTLPSSFSLEIYFKDILINKWLVHKIKEVLRLWLILLFVCLFFNILSQLKTQPWWDARILANFDARI